MNDSAFNRSLDAMVRGETGGGHHDLAGFAAELYRKEHDVMMPTALKSAMGARLGLDSDNESTASAPVSRRTVRAKAPAHDYARRPWSIAAAIIIAITLAFTGILQWSLPSGNNGDRDNRFGVLSPAIPTVDATPAAQPDNAPRNETSWFSPVSSDECPANEMITRGEWIERQQDLATTYEEVERKDIPFGKPERADADAVVIRNRQAVSCQGLETDDVLPMESARWAWESQIMSETLRNEVFADRLQRSKAFSEHIENDLGLVPTDLLHKSELETGRVWDPANAVQMADGRIALVTGWLAPAEQELPTASSIANVWIERDGQWLLDESLFFCIGDCEEYWAEHEAELGSSATPSASPVTDSVCIIPEAFEADFEIAAAGPVNLRPGPSVDSGDAIVALSVGSEVTYLCESRVTSDPATDDVEPGDHWLKIRTKDGVDGWIRETDLEIIPGSESTAVPPTSESTLVPMGDDHPVTPVPTASISTEIVPLESSAYPTPASTDGDNRGSFTPTPAEGGVEILPYEPSPTPMG